jgi:glutamate/tyrosine decarboxylase-like PLP-dependent enzyme
VVLTDVRAGVGSLRDAPYAPASEQATRDLPKFAECLPADLASSTVCDPAFGSTIYAALRALGRSGVEDLIDRTCARAKEIAAGLGELPGCELLNDVMLNQVLIRFEDDAETDRVVATVQASGEAWMGGTVWDGLRAIRISVSNWQTSEADVARMIAAFRAARAS